MANKSVEFNLWIESKRVVRLHVGQTKSFRHSEETEEGYTYEAVELHYSDDGFIYMETASGGSDCDGPIHHYSSYVCRDCELSGSLSPNGLYQWPAWVDKKSSVRDVYAEQMGY